MKRVLFALACVPLIGAGVFYVRGAEQRSAATRHTSSTPDAPQLRAFVSRYCVACHNSTVKSGNLVLDPAAALQPADHPEVWEKVVRKLRGRYMPPAGA